MRFMHFYICLATISTQYRTCLPAHGSLKKKMTANFTATVCMPPSLVFAGHTLPLCVYANSCVHHVFKHTSEGLSWHTDEDGSGGW